MTGDEIQIEHGGFVRIHHEILERLAETELTGRESRILFALLRLTYGYNKKEDAISLAQWCEVTGMKKANVSVTLKELTERRIINRTETGTGRGHVAIYGFNKYHEQWDTPSETDERLSLKVTGVDNLSSLERLSQTANKGYPKRTKKVIPDHEQPKDSIKSKDSKDKKKGATPHPPSAAVEYLRNLNEHYPSKPQMKLIDATVTDFPLWKAAVDAWIGRKYNPTNVSGMLDWYQHPEKYQHKGAVNGPGPRSFAQQSMDAAEEYRRRKEGMFGGHNEPVEDAFRLLSQNAGRT